MIINIKEERLDRYQNDENMQEYLELVKEFQQLSGIENFLFGDTEDFYEISSYVDLLEEMSVLAAEEVKIADISGIVENGQYVFSFTLNGEQNDLSMSDPDTDWLAMDFVVTINEKLKPFTSKGFHDVFTAGMDNIDQCYEFAFIDRKTLETLAEHPSVFAELHD